MTDIDINSCIGQLEAENAKLRKALRDTVGVLTEPGEMKDGKWNAWRKRAVAGARKVLGDATDET